MFRERIRMQAAVMFADGQGNAVIARELRVSVRSVQRWRREWEDSGEGGLRSKGPASKPKLSDALFTVLEEELAKGPVAHGWPDQRWTLARIKTLIGRRFHKSMTLSGIAQMLRRHGWSHQVPARRALERDEEAVAGWVKETWSQVEARRRRSEPGSSSRTRPDSR
ncbi:hypothetical protein T261_08953 [Streptomyces lydicus]|nr:hypothetical protein T261_1592 [Streptomyces lydicus]AQY20671.1 hypothetical protein T261_08953 [Streptomyces lydicus]